MHKLCCSLVGLLWSLMAVMPSVAHAQEVRSSDNSWLTALGAGAQEVLSAGDSVLQKAFSLIGVRYVRGGNDPETGLDCSGLVHLVYRETLGTLLPRQSAAMSEVGDKVAVNDLKPGDLVFFNTLRHAFSHVGIYVGDGKFLHAPSKGKTVRVDELGASYWTKRFNGARRVMKEALSESESARLRAELMQAQTSVPSAKVTPPAIQ